MNETQKNRRRWGCWILMVAAIALVAWLGCRVWMLVQVSDERGDFMRVGMAIEYFYRVNDGALRPFRYPENAVRPEEMQRLLEAGLIAYSSRVAYEEQHASYDAYMKYRTNVNPDLDAQPLYSWRMMLDSYECGMYWWDERCGFDEPMLRVWEPWNSKANRKVGETFGTPFCRRTDGGPDDGNQDTDIVAIIGPATAWGDGRSEPYSLEEIDGDTILCVESADSGIHWMEPRDFDIRTIPRTINDPSGRGISSENRLGFCVLFADGEVWCLSHKTPFEELEKFFTVEGAKKYDRQKVLGPYKKCG